MHRSTCCCSLWLYSFQNNSNSPCASQLFKYYQITITEVPYRSRYLIYSHVIFTAWLTLYFMFHKRWRKMNLCRLLQTIFLKHWLFGIGCRCIVWNLIILDPNRTTPGSSRFCICFLFHSYVFLAIISAWVTLICFARYQKEIVFVEFPLI